jgi:hypothetical protein
MVGENRVSLLHTDRTSGLRVVCPLCHDGPYVKSQYRTSALRVFRENLIFSSLSAYSPTSKATRNTLKAYSIVYNLHAT